MTAPPLRALAYTRQSESRPGETRDSSLSLNAQADAFRRWCDRTGAVPVAVVADHDLRGHDPARPGLRALLDTAERERVDLVWVVSLSRFARDHILQELVWRDLQARGVTHLHSEVETGTDDEFVRGLHGLMHARTRREQSMHLRNAFATRARTGAFPVGAAPYGYRRPHQITVTRANGTSYERATGTPEIDPAQAEVVRAVYTRAAAGDTLSSITRWLRATTPTARGGTWRHRHLAKLLANPIYRGAIAHRGVVVGHNPAWAIVSDELWHAAQARLATAPRTRRRTDLPRPWLDGLVLHACGRRMHVERAGPARAPYWRCNGASDGTCSLARVAVMDHRLAPAVRAVLTADLGARRTPAEALRIAQERAGGQDAARAHATLDRRARAATARHGRMLDRFAEGKLPPAVMDDEDARLEAELAAVALERGTIPAPPDPAALRVLAARLTTVAGLLAVMTEDELRALVRDLGHVVVTETGVRIAYRPELVALVLGVEWPLPRGRGWATRAPGEIDADLPRQTH